MDSRCHATCRQFESNNTRRRGRGSDADKFIAASTLSEPKYAPLRLAARLLDRVNELQVDKPDLAGKLMSVIQRWPAPVIFQNIVERIADGTADRLAVGQ